MQWTVAMDDDRRLLPKNSRNHTTRVADYRHYRRDDQGLSGERGNTQKMAFECILQHAWPLWYQSTCSAQSGKTFQRDTFIFTADKVNGYRVADQGTQGNQCHGNGLRALCYVFYAIYDMLHVLCCVFICFVFYVMFCTVCSKRKFLWCVHYY